MGAQLVVLDKEYGTQPLGIGECWRREIAKSASKICREDDKAAYGCTQLSAGLEAGIEGTLYLVALQVAEHDTMEFSE